MDSINHYLFQISSSFSVKDILIIILISILMGEFINFAYRITHDKAPDKFLTSALLLYILACSVVIYVTNYFSSIIILIIILLAGIFFDKSISIKYKDSHIFLIWSVVCGILNAEKKFVISSIFCVLVFIIFWISKKMRDDMSKLLIIEGDSSRELEVQSAVFKIFRKKAKLILKNNDDNSFKLIYRISSNAIDNLRNKRISMLEEIEKNGGVTNVTICNEDELDEK